MGNCLKTQLKEVVQNENLIKLNHLKLLVSGNSGTIKIVGSSFYFDDALQSDGTTYTITNSGVIDIVDKYSVTSIEAPNSSSGIIFDDNLMYCTKLQSLLINANKINFNSLEHLTVLRGIIAPYGTNNTGDITKLKTTLLSTVDITANKNVTGDISFFGNMPINILNIQQSGIDGDLEGYFKNRIMKNRLTNVDSQYIGYSSKVKFGGVSVAKDPSANKCVLYTTDNGDNTYTCGIAYGGTEETATHKYYAVYNKTTDTWSGYNEINS